MSDDIKLIGTTRIVDPDGMSVYVDDNNVVVYPDDIAGTTRVVDRDTDMVTYIDENGRVRAEGGYIP